MISKTKLLLISLGLFLTWHLSAQWNIVECPASTDLNAICLSDDGSGWIVGNDGTILYKCTDGWYQYDRVTNADLYSVFFIKKDDGWAVGANGTVLHYDGDKWKNIECPAREHLYSVSFSDSAHGVAVGARGTILCYENGNWELSENVKRGNLYAVSSVNNITYLGGGGQEAISTPIMSLPDNSISELIQTFDPGFIEIKAISIVNNNAWAVGRPGTILSFDGTSWRKVNMFEKLPSLKSVYFSDENNGIAVGYGGIILTYSDENWTIESSPISTKLNGATISGDTFYAVGNKGTIISCQREKEITETPDISTYSELSCYPNPSSDLLNIIIPGSDESTTGEISIINIYGQVVLKEIISSCSSSQTVPISTSNLSNGIYLVSYTYSGNNSSGKFIVKH